MRIFAALHYSEWSMKRKLFGYMLLLTSLLLLTLVSGLFLFGRFDSAGKNAYEALDLQMKVFEKDIFSGIDRLAAAGIQLSEDTSGLLDEYFMQHGISVHDLNDSPSNIAGIQDVLADLLKQSMLQENCSGAFIMLDATANSSQKDASHSRTGLYFQQSGYKTSKRSIYLYRGLTDAGRRHGISLHNNWRLEFCVDDFPNFEKALANAALPLEDAYFLTDLFTLPGMSEKAVLMVLPMTGTDGTFYGVCGFEIRESYFVTHHAQPANITHLTCIFTADNTADKVLDASAGLSCGVSKDYYRAPKGSLLIKSMQHGLSCLAGEELSYIGLTKSIRLSPNNAPYTLAVMMLKSDYDRAVTKTILQNLILWLLILFFTVSCCMFFSRRYLSPILKGLEQIKSDQRTQAQSPYMEINDLFAFLAEQDQKHEASINTLTEEKQAAQSEKNRLELEYEQARLVYEKAESEYLRAQEELAGAKTELDRLAYSRKNEIAPDDYQRFLDGIQELTQTEREIFFWYLDGLSAADILERTGTMKSTLKFHNHNILNKLGVSSRKQMLRYAALMKQPGEGGDAV